MKKRNKIDWQKTKHYGVKALALIAMYYGPTRIAGKLLTLIKSKRLRMLLLLVLEPLLERIIKRFYSRTEKKASSLPMLEK